VERNDVLAITWLEKVVLIFYGEQVVRRKGDEDNFEVTWIIRNVKKGFFLWGTVR
jgi:hypothetical protein